MFSSQDLLQVVQASQVPFAVFDKSSGEYSFQFTNKAYLSLFRLDEKKIEGKSIKAALASPWFPENTQFLAHVFQSLDKVLATRLPDRLTNIRINLLSDDGSKAEQRLADIENTPVIRNGRVESVSQSIFLKDASEEPDLYTDFRIHPSHAAEIARTRNELQKILKSSLDVICTVDANGCFLTVSAAAQNIWGYSPNELTGRRYMDLVYEADKDLTIEAARDIMGGTDMTNFENRYVRKDGTLVSMVWSARWDDADQTMYCIAKDATEKKLAEEALIKNEKRYRSLVENGADAVVIFDQSAKAKYVSPSITRVLGYTEDEAMAIELNDLLHPSDREAVAQKMYEIFKRPGETISGQTARIKHKNGTWRWIEATLTNMIHDPMINGIVDNFRDVTDRTEVELEKNLLLDNTEESFILLNTELNIVTYNRQFEELYQTYFNVSIEKGASILLYAQPERREMVADVYRKVLLGESIVSELKVLYPRTKEKRIFQLKYKPAKGNIGEIIGAFVTATDITDKQLVLDRLIESEEKYKLLFQSSPLPKFVYDLATFQILDVNDRAIAHYGYTQEELLERSILNIWPEHEHKRVIDLHENIRTNDAPLKLGIHVHRKKDGGLIKSEVSGYKFDYSGRQCVMAVYNDVTEREKTLQRIKENEVKLLAAQKIAKLGYWQSFPDKRGLYWSDEVYNIWEVKKVDFHLDYESHFNTIHPDDREEFLRSRDKAFAEGAQHDVEHRIILPNGSIKWVHALGNLIRNESGEVVIFEGTVQDITKEKISLDNLMLSEARHRGIIESQTSYLIRTDLQGKYTFCNSKFKNDFGWLYEGKEIIGEHALSSILKYHHIRVAETVNKCFNELNKVFQVMIDKPRQGTGVVTTLWDFICLTDSKGQPSEIQCVGIDVSEWKKAQEELEQSNARYENVMRATSDAIWDWDLKTGHVYWGKGFDTLFGYSLEELNNWTTFWGDNVHPEDRKRVFSDVRNIIRGKNEIWIQEYRFRKANGDYAFVIDKGILIKDNLGAPVKMVGAIQDVSQLKELNTVLENNVRDLAISNRELEQFAYVASHDLQEPLRMISSFLTQLQRKYSGQLDSKANQYIDFAVDGAKRMRQIILDLLDFSRVGRVDMEIQSVSLNEVINDILILYRKKTDETNALFIISDMPSINVPKASIRQLFQNLISNALKYQAPQNSPLIEIGFTEDPGQWQFWVKDNGIGISPEYFDKVFIIFQRLHTKDQYSGTGMGLAICRKIAENLGGKLWIESEEGEGSTFYFTVPKVIHS